MKYAVRFHRADKLARAEAIEQVAVNEVDLPLGKGAIYRLNVRHTRLDHVQLIPQRIKILQATAPAVDTKYLHIRLLQQHLGHMATRKTCNPRNKNSQNCLPI